MPRPEADVSVEAPAVCKLFEGFASGWQRHASPVHLVNIRTAAASEALAFRRLPSAIAQHKPLSGEVVTLIREALAELR